MKRGLARGAVVASVLLVLGASGLMCQRVARRGRFAAPFSTYGAGPDGTRALYLLTGSRGRDAERWVEDLGGLPDDGVLVALGGCEGGLRRRLSRYEEERLDAWIRGGGVLLVGGVAGYLGDAAPVRLRRVPGQCDRGLLAWLLGEDEEEDQEDDREEDHEEDPREAGKEVPEEADGDEGTGEGPPAPERSHPQAFGPDPLGDEEVLDEGLPPMHWATVRSAVLEGLGALPVREPALIEVDEGAESETLLELEGEPVAVAVRQGEGTILALSSASLLQNREIGQVDGGALFVRLLDHYAPGAAVRFDEYHLGVGTTRSIVKYVRQVGGGAIALQLLVVVLFGLLRHGARFGAPQVPAPALPGGTASYVRSLGGLYRKTGDRRAALEVVADGAFRRIAAHHHLPPTASSELAAALRPRSEEAAAAVAEITALATGEEVSENGLLARTRKIDAIVARVIDDTERKA